MYYVEFAFYICFTASKTGVLFSLNSASCAAFSSLILKIKKILDKIEYISGK